jgi:hypothetical protein
LIDAIEEHSYVLKINLYAKKMNPRIRSSVPRIANHFYILQGAAVSLASWRFSGRGRGDLPLLGGRPYDGAAEMEACEQGNVVATAAARPDEHQGDQE